MTDEKFDGGEPVVLEIDGVLDLHAFSPKDLKTLVPDYLAACAEKGLREVKIVHGKGKGNLRRSVHALLERNPMVAGYSLGDGHSGNWGVTVVLLRIPH